MPSAYDQRNMMAGLEGFAQAFGTLQKKRKEEEEKKLLDQIANELLEGEGMPSGGGFKSLEMQLKIAQIKKALSERKPQYVGVPEKPEVDDETGLYWDGRSWKRVPYYNRTTNSGQIEQTPPQVDPKTGLYWDGKAWKQWKPAAEIATNVQEYDALDKEIAKLRGEVASGNKRWGPDNWGLGTAYEDQLKGKLAERQALEAQGRTVPAIQAPQPKVVDERNRIAKEVTRRTKDGRLAVFDAETKEFLRFAD